MRRLAIIPGALIIGAAAHVSIVASGGYGGQTAPLLLAVALGLVASAICIGVAWSDSRYGLASCFIIAMLAGELFAIITTADRIVTSREIQQAPAKEAQRAHAKALRRLAEAELALAEIPATSERLEAAIARQASADDAVIAKSAERNCLANCRALLQDQVDGAQAEVSAARSELANLRNAAEVELKAARAGVASMSAPASATPLADRLGIAGWTLDLITAALASIAVNGLGATLIAFGAHGANKQQEAENSQIEIEPMSDRALSVPSKALPTPNARQQAAKFGRDMLVPADAMVPLAELYGAYVDWCKTNDLSPLPVRKVGKAMDNLFERAGLAIQVVEGRPHLIGAQLKELGAAPEVRA